MTKSIITALASLNARSALSIRLELLLIACVLSAAACSKTTTSAKLRDPSQVSLSFRRLGQASIQPIHQGSDDMEMGLRGLGVEQAGLLRKQNNAIVLECASCLDGTIHLLSEKGATARADMSVQEIVESRETSRKKIKLGYEYEVSDELSLFPEIESEWSNVEYFDQTSEPVRALGWVLVPGGFLTVAGVLVMVLADAPGAGLALLLPGIALDAFGVIQLVKSPVTERFDPDGQARVAPPPVTIKEEEPRPAPKAKPKKVETPKKDEMVKTATVKEEKPTEEPPAEKKKAEKEEKKEKVEEKAEEPKQEKKSKEKKKADQEKQKKKADKKGGKEENLDDFLL